MGLIDEDDHSNFDQQLQERREDWRIVLMLSLAASGIALLLVYTLLV